MGGRRLRKGWYSASYPVDSDTSVDERNHVGGIFYRCSGAGGSKEQNEVVEFGHFCVYSVNERRTACPIDDLSRLILTSAMG
jgi:hypothetical protein